MARSKSSKQWLREHFDDEYVRRSQGGRYRSRASYKLLEMHDKDGLISIEEFLEVAREIEPEG